MKYIKTLPAQFIKDIEQTPYNIQDLNEDTLKSFIDSVFICVGTDYKYLLTNK